MKERKASSEREGELWHFFDRPVSVRQKSVAKKNRKKGNRVPKVKKPKILKPNPSAPQNCVPWPSFPSPPPPTRPCVFVLRSLCSNSHWKSANGKNKSHTSKIPFDTQDAHCLSLSSPNHAAFACMFVSHRFLSFRIHSQT